MGREINDIDQKTGDCARCGAVTASGALKGMKVGTGAKLLRYCNWGVWSLVGSDLLPASPTNL